VHLTNEQLANHFLTIQQPINDIVVYLTVCQKLLKNYGKIVYSSAYFSLVTHISPELKNFLLILKASKKDSSEDIKHLIRIIKEKSSDYHPEFVVKTDSSDHYQQISSFLDTTFTNNTITQHTSKWNSIRVSWEWWYYKRWLEQDIKKLLRL